MNGPAACMACVLALILVVPVVGQAPQGTVHLNNGGRIHGELMEVLPGEQVRLRLADGSVRTVPWSEIARVDDPSAAPAASAPAASTPPEQPAAQPPPPPLAATAPSQALDYERLEPQDDGSAQDVAERSKQVTLTLFGAAGFAGTISGDATVYASDGLNSESVTRNAEADLEPSFGGGAHVDAPLHTHFSLGAFARVLSFKAQGDDRGLFIDFALAPRARFPFAVGEHWGAFYLEVDFGIGVVDIPGDAPSVTSTGVAVDVSTGPLFLAGGGAGLQLLLTDVVGFVFELAWHHHFFSESRSAMVATASGVQTAGSDADFEGGQLMLQAGLMLAF